MRRLEFSLALTLLLGVCAIGCDPASAKAKAERLSSAGRANIALSQGYLQQGQLKKASDRAAKALASDPGSAEVHALLAMIEASQGEHKKAEKAFDRALRLAPFDGSVLNAYASWLCERGETAQADEEFAKALRDGNYHSPVQAMKNAGKCAHQAGQWAKAEAYLRKALKITPEDRQVLLLLADAELRQGKILEAQAFIQRSDGLGGDAATLDLAARIEDAANNRLAAARYRKRLRDEFPNHAPTGEGARTP